MRRLALAAVAALPLALVACQATGTPVTVNDVTLLRYAPQDGLPTALMTGTLEIRNGCVWIENEQLTSLLLWPPDTTLESVDGELHIRLRSTFDATDGTPVALGGGIQPDRAAVERLVGTIPPACVSDDVWIVSSASTSVPS